MHKFHCDICKKHFYSEGKLQEHIGQGCFQTSTAPSTKSDSAVHEERGTTSFSKPVVKNSASDSKMPTSGNHSLILENRSQNISSGVSAVQSSGNSSEVLMDNSQKPVCGSQGRESFDANCLSLQMTGIHTARKHAPLLSLVDNTSGTIPLSRRNVIPSLQQQRNDKTAVEVSKPEILIYKASFLNVLKKYFAGKARLIKEETNPTHAVSDTAAQPRSQSDLTCHLSAVSRRSVSTMSGSSVSSTPATVSILGTNSTTDLMVDSRMKDVSRKLSILQKHPTTVSEMSVSGSVVDKSSQPSASNGIPMSPVSKPCLQTLQMNASVDLPQIKQEPGVPDPVSRQCESINYQPVSDVIKTEISNESFQQSCFPFSELIENAKSAGVVDTSAQPSASNGISALPMSEPCLQTLQVNDSPDLQQIKQEPGFPDPVSRQSESVYYQPLSAVIKTEISDETFQQSNCTYSELTENAKSQKVCVPFTMLSDQELHGYECEHIELQNVNKYKVENKDEVSETPCYEEPIFMEAQKMAQSSGTVKVEVEMDSEKQSSQFTSVGVGTCDNQRKHGQNANGEEFVPPLKKLKPLEVPVNEDSTVESIGRPRTSTWSMEKCEEKVKSKRENPDENVLERNDIVVLNERTNHSYVGAGDVEIQYLCGLCQEKFDLPQKFVTHLLVHANEAKKSGTKLVQITALFDTDFI